MDGEYKKPLLKKLESLFISGVSDASWLGETAVAAETRPKDAQENSLDLFVFFDLKAPLLDEETSLSLENLTLGANFTLENSREKIKSLLLKTLKSDKTPGFSYLGENAVKIPRLVLGLSDFDIDRTSENLDSPSALKARFKLLAEMKAELDLYLTIFSEKLPKSLPTSAETPVSPEEASSLKNYANLTLANSLVSSALFSSIETLLDRDLLPAPPRKVERVPRKLLAYAEDFFIKELSDFFREETLAKKAKPFYERVRVTDNDTFVQLLSLSRELKSSAF